MVATLAIVLAFVAAGCRSDPPVAGCGLCGPSLVAADGDGVVVAQGRTLWRFSGDGTRTSEGVLVPRAGDHGVQAVTVTDGVAWVAVGRRLVTVAADGTVVRRSGRPSAYVHGIAAGPDGVWLAAGRQVVRLTPGSQRALRPTAVTTPWAIALAPTGRSVWVAGFGAALQRIAVTGERTTLRVPSSAYLAASDGALWSLTREGVLQRRDPVTGRASGAPLDVRGEATSLAAAAGVVWVGLREGNVVRVDPSGPRIVWTRGIPIT